LVKAYTKKVGSDNPHTLWWGCRPRCPCNENKGLERTSLECINTT